MRAEDYGPWALIIGGSEGIGASFARQLAAEGFNLVLLARREGPLATLREELTADFGVDVRTLGLDITDAAAPARVEALTADIEVGLLVCNAGAFHDVAEFLDRPVDDARAMIALNVTVPTVFAHIYGGAMRMRRRGGIIFVGSLACLAGNGKVAVYAAAKAYVKILAEGLWQELKPHGVDVLGLILGPTRTPAFERDGFDTQNAQFAMADPNDAARDGLQYLGAGPIRIPDGCAEFAGHVSALPRADAVAVLSAGIAAITLRPAG